MLAASLVVIGTDLACSLLGSLSAVMLLALVPDLEGTTFMASQLNGYTPQVLKSAMTFAGVTDCNQAFEKAIKVKPSHYFARITLEKSMAHRPPLSLQG